MPKLLFFFILTLLVPLQLDLESYCQELPVGSQPEALEFPYFPDKAHAVVFRNWFLVSPDRLAETLLTNRDTILKMAESMGLPSADDSWKVIEKRGYITVVRRNWHLLPYEQILTLTGMTQKELHFSLIEDDFLFIKLGSLKPKCERVRYQKPSEEVKAQVKKIKAIVESFFTQETLKERDLPFSFIEKLKKPIASPEKFDLKTQSQQLRFIYSYFGSYGDPLSDPSLDPYPDGLLQRLSQQGVTGVWLHTVLRQLAPGKPYFPEFGEGWELRLKNLRELVARAQQYGIEVFLYMNEPRAMPHTFFDNNKNIAGVRERELTAMCTSVPEVRAWLRDSLTHVFKEVPDLGGIFSISASENLTNCISHFQNQNCPRCKNRTEAEIISEVIATMAEGVSKASSTAKVIAWDWGWNRHRESPLTIEKLPKNVWLQSVSEWSLPIERGGIKTRVGEYSISSIGPGPRALAQWKAAKKRGLKTSAKVQFNATWELASVPYIPVLNLVAEHCRRLAEAEVDGYMLSWTVGGYPSPNLQVAAQFAAKPKAKVAQILRNIAHSRYGKMGGEDVLKAWEHFSHAFKNFPYHISVVYKGPQQMGPANPWYSKPSRYRATMVGIPYDDLDGWRGPYPRNIFVQQFEALTQEWRKGLEIMRSLPAKLKGKFQETAVEDLGVCEAIYHHYLSVAQQSRFIILRDQLLNNSLPQAQKDKLQSEIKALAETEIQSAHRLFELAWKDSRLGFEASNHYFYVPLDCIEKVLSCKFVLEQFEN